MQTVFIDFDGEEVNTGVFGGSGVRDLSPLSAFLGRWGLSAADEDDFGEDTFNSNEGFTGIEDTRSRSAFGLTGDVTDEGPAGAHPCTRVGACVRAL